jgi:prepilin-type N-terminal cleavage/methylation domain-containing protein
MFQKNKKGFTLIELMVVIAIIAILATVVLVALQGARDAAEDSKRKSALSQVRSVAEVYYATNDRSYANLDGNDAEIAQLKAEHEEGDGNLTIHSSDDDYCAYIELTGHDAANNDYDYFCLSNTQPPKTYDTDVSATDLCTATTFVCE